MSTPSDVLAAMLRSDPARPRVTCYDDTPGPTGGERIELSAKVLANWVNKAANALQDEWDLGPGMTVRLALPPHWRSLYWALAAWSVGATVVPDDVAHDGDDHRDFDLACDLVVTDDAEVAALAATSAGPVVLVTLAALARSAGDPVPAGVMDEARELATYADQFSAWEEPGPSEVALSGHGEPLTFDDVVPRVDWADGVRVHTTQQDLRAFLLHALAAWSRDGSLVLSRGPVPAAGYDSRLAAEGVTLTT